MKSLVCTINCKFCDSSPTCLQTCSCKMYYVVHKFPHISKAAIHLGTHSHLVTKGIYRKYRISNPINNVNNILVYLHTIHHEPLENEWTQPFPLNNCIQFPPHNALNFCVLHLEQIKLLPSLFTKKIVVLNIVITKQCFQFKDTVKGARVIETMLQ